MSGGGGGGGATLPPFPQGANYVFQNQPQADVSAFGGIQALQNNAFWPQPGQQSLLTPSAQTFANMVGAQLPQIKNTFAAFQPGLSPLVNDQLIWGANDPNAVYTPPPPPPPPPPMAPPPPVMQPSIQSAITPTEAQGYMGTYSPGSMGGLAGMGPLDPSFLNLAENVNWSNPTNDQMLAWSMMKDPGGMKQTFQGDSAFTTPSSVSDALNPGEQGILNAIALQPGYQGSAPAYGGPIGGNNPPSMAAPAPAAPTSPAVSALASAAGGMAPASGLGATNAASGIFSGMPGGSGGNPNPTAAASQFAGGGIANPAADAFAQFAPYLSSMGLNIGPQAEAMGATILGQIGLGGPGATVQSQLYNRTLQRVQDQQRAANEAAGLGTTPYGAGLEQQALNNFNIDWTNTQLGRTIQGMTAANAIDQSGLTAEQQAMNNLQGGAMGATAPTQQVIGDFLNYLSGATAQNNAAIAGYSAQANAALQNQQLMNQQSQANAGMLGQLGSGLGSIVGGGLGKG